MTLCSSCSGALAGKVHYEEATDLKRFPTGEFKRFVVLTEELALAGVCRGRPTDMLVASLQDEYCWDLPRRSLDAVPHLRKLSLMSNRVKRLKEFQGASSFFVGK